MTASSSWPCETGFGQGAGKGRIFPGQPPVPKSRFGGNFLHRTSRQSAEALRAGVTKTWATLSAICAGEWSGMRSGSFTAAPWRASCRKTGGPASPLAMGAFGMAIIAASLICSRTTLVFGLAQHGHRRRVRGEEPNPVLLWNAPSEAGLNSVVTRRCATERHVRPNVRMR